MSLGNGIVSSTHMHQSDITFTKYYFVHQRAQDEAMRMHQQIHEQVGRASACVCACVWCGICVVWYMCVWYICVSEYVSVRALERSLKEKMLEPSHTHAHTHT